MGKKLAEADPHIGATSNQDLSRWTEDGTPESIPVWPFIVEYEPFDVYGWTDAW